ncbi:hypothetical protein GCM10025882_01930 [Acinetobacter gyllenbergii]|uniref:Pyocin activator protein PrtN n=1 Tax=Acinetobacter gyllenbergii CIP 110306 = MTCC 11365 TaxID=1217657 RepID=A0A829HEH8_9GAMM|nr:pyocin activator PrtN family protein [Acinetobacter gyllenbergii]EPF75020.1 hypothetical protein F957_03216 [Acinetobacter gyllenbergii CIP 110306 = MTCC 11365]GMA09769.1 hypothetical protein GCM10025882_01930 [Acinetobacter gyllenbergii]
MVTDLKTFDYLFLKYRSIYIKLDVVVEEYYPNLCKEKMMIRARLQKFPFTCFRIDESQKGAIFVNIHELAEALDDIYSKNYAIFKNSTSKAIKSTS